MIIRNNWQLVNLFTSLNISRCLRIVIRKIANLKYENPEMETCKEKNDKFGNDGIGRKHIFQFALPFFSLL